MVRPALWVPPVLLEPLAPPALLVPLENKETEARRVHKGPWVPLVPLELEECRVPKDLVVTKVRRERLEREG